MHRKNDLPPGASVGLVLIVWAALLCAALAWLLAASVASAQTVKEWQGPSYSFAPQRSYIEIHAPERDGAVATVTFQNAPVHGAGDVERFNLTWQGVTVEIHFDYQGGHPDTVFVVPPAGLVAVPQEISVPETGADAIHLYDTTKAGM